MIFQRGPAAGGFDFSAGGLDPKLERALEREGWPKPVYDFVQNPIDPALVALGRKLFYDVRLSSDGSGIAAPVWECADPHAGDLHVVNQPLIL